MRVCVCAHACVHVCVQVSSCCCLGQFIVVTFLCVQKEFEGDVLETQHDWLMGGSVLQSLWRGLLSQMVAVSTLYTL